MKRFPFIIGLILLVISCTDTAEKEIVKPLAVPTTVTLKVPETSIDKAKLFYNNKNSLWTLNDELYSGHAVSYFPDSTLMQKIGILDGRKQNEMIDYYPNGKMSRIANYHLGKLHGEKKSWNNDSAHRLATHYNYTNGKANGEQKKWYPTGEIFKILQLEMGIEVGIQQAFRKNGVVYANYEAKDGRIFGMKKAAVCFKVEDGEINNPLEK